MAGAQFATESVGKEVGDLGLYPNSKEHHSRG